MSARWTNVIVKRIEKKLRISLVLVNFGVASLFFRPFVDDESVLIVVFFRRFLRMTSSYPADTTMYSFGYRKQYRLHTWKYYVCFVDQSVVTLWKHWIWFETIDNIKCIGYIWMIIWYLKIEPLIMITTLIDIRW